YGRGGAVEGDRAGADRAAGAVAAAAPPILTHRRREGCRCHRSSAGTYGVPTVLHAPCAARTAPEIHSRTMCRGRACRRSRWVTSQAGRLGIGVGAGNSRRGGAGRTGNRGGGGGAAPAPAGV